MKFQGPLTEQTSYTLDLSRRPIMDSLLSYAGAYDSRSGMTWGGVTATGGRLDVTWDNGSYGIYGYTDLRVLTGSNVASNRKIEGGGGAYWRLLNDVDDTFTAGVSLTVAMYQKNLRYFTYGHGGYFSPQQYYGLSFPMDWTGRSGNLGYQIKASIGIQSFKENASDYFPTSSEWQTAAVDSAYRMAAQGLTLNGQAIYPGQAKTGLGYNIGGAMEYQLSSQLFLGGQLGTDNASNYKQTFGGLYMRYAFQRQDSQIQVPPIPPRIAHGL
jgi:cellulose synthase operon protein C